MYAGVSSSYEINTPAYARLERVLNRLHILAVLGTGEAHDYLNLAFISAIRGERTTKLRPRKPEPRTSAFSAISVL